eukprot:GFUD01006092.1.p1 GENE.GFUD01006092.1~~GFUD01006092.1.p1  ORF type:complete len:633 (-),score=198.71 GFUD01006092.1:142-2040(-)
MGQMGMMGAPARPAPVVPSQGNMFPAQQQFLPPGQQMMQQQPQNFLTVPGPGTAGQFSVSQEQNQEPLGGSGGNLILSNSFTEPGPVDLDPMTDPFAESSKSENTADFTDGGSSFYIDENEISADNKEEAKADDVKEEEKETPEPDTPKEGEAVTPQPKTSFWSRWSRNKEAGSKEDILDETDKKATKENDEGRGGNEQKFLGDGQTFKGKLIGVLEVREARGDRMCQDALQELKMAIKASGEHKQKVNIQIAVDGLKIRDEKSGDCLYHHPVHKISFIAQDMTDNRAFGYIYGSPENGHRFFGIKTEKAAGQVVVAMRDLFQVVFELKKKEIDEAKQNIETGDSVTDSTKAAATSAASFPDGAAPAATKSSAIDDLLGLENEISAIQAGIQQIDKITPNPPMSFQTDSMLPLSLSGPQVPQQPIVQQPATKKPVAVMNQNPASDYGTAPFLPPPPSKVGRRQEDRYAVFDNVQSPRFPQTQNPAEPQQNTQGFGNTPFLDSGAAGDSNVPSIFSQPPSLGLSDAGSGSGMFGGINQSQGIFGQPVQQQQPQIASPAPKPTGAAPRNSGSQDLASMFTDLDPLGSGKSKPFVDKKNFFNDSKAKLKMTGASEDSLTNPFLHPMYQSRSLNLM